VELKCDDVVPPGSQSPDQWTAFAQLTSGNNTPNTQGIRLGNFVAVREVIESELENILGGTKSVQQGLDDAVTRGNDVVTSCSLGSEGGSSMRRSSR
jgi:ABC-type glycerol-3-phosphate transport system substrate-binding protein